MSLRCETAISYFFTRIPGDLKESAASICDSSAVIKQLWFGV